MLSSFAADLLRLHRWHKHKDQLAEVLSAVKRIPGEAILKVSCHSLLNGSTCMYCTFGLSWLDVTKEQDHFVLNVKA